MHVRAEAVAGAVGDADDLTLRDVLPGTDREARLVGVARRDAAAVVDARVVAVAARRRLRLGEGHRPGRRGAHRSTARDRDVDARVQATPAHTEGRDDRPVDRPDEVARAALDRPRRPDRDAGLRGAQLRLYLRLFALERVQVPLEILARGADRAQRAVALVARGHQVALAADDRVLRGGDLVALREDLVGGVGDLGLERRELLGLLVHLVGEV